MKILSAEDIFSQTGNGRKGLPAWTFNNAELAQLEMQQVFLHNWFWIGHVSDIPNTGDYKCQELGNERAVVVRGEDGEIRAFHNLCRHRGSRVVEGDEGNCKKAMVCPFHAWSYHLDGRLKTIPRADTFPEIDKSEYGLKPLDCEVWHGLIFIRFDGDGSSVAETMAPAETEVGLYKMADMKPYDEYWHFDFNLDWKAVLDIDNEGYHVPKGHPELFDLFGTSYQDQVLECGLSRAHGYLKEKPAQSALVQNYIDTLPKASYLPESHQRIWIYWGMFPGFVITLMPDMVEIYQTYSLGHQKSIMAGACYALDDDRTEMQKVREYNREINMTVGEEDIKLVKYSDQGMRSQVYEGALLSDLELGIAAFQNQLRDLLPVVTLDQPPEDGKLAIKNQEILDARPRYAPLFEPVKIGPVTAPNRFYQVPHCAGMGYNRPQMMATMRGVKAEGGWGVVCTEFCSIHPTSDDMPFPHASIWDQDDVTNLKLMTEAVHAQGSLAGVELWYGGRSAANLYSREASYGATSKTNDALVGMPVQTQAMTLDDIVELRGWFQDAARRAIEAGFDIVYVYANHHYLLSEFLSAESNTRTDQYGGCAENRVRLIREIIEDTLATVKGKCAVAVRYSIPADIGHDPDEYFEMFESIAELPDLWDITVTDYSREMGSSRFIKEAANQDAVKKIKSATGKPVVSVGRFTSPDTMLKQITNGTQDFIGAARPSIADPYLPNKIKTGRLDEIRECIGCNVCYAHDSLGSPIRCTQNPTMGEEWRRGWHPDRIAKKHADESVLIIGGGPAGLEAACALGQRGYEVTLAEAGTELGGRINTETRLPGLSEWARVRDWRLTQLAKMPNVGIYPDNSLDAAAVIDFESQHLMVATGARWRTDGVGRYLSSAFEGYDSGSVVSAESILNGRVPQGRVVIYDDDHYYLGSAIALKLHAENVPVTLVTPEARIGGWSSYTTEQYPLIQQLIDIGVGMIGDKGLAGWNGKAAQLECVFSGAISEIEADYLISVTARLPNDELFLALEARSEDFKSKGGISLRRFGDCQMPGIIATAVYAGHKAARELGEPETNLDDLRRDRIVITKLEPFA